MKADLHHSNLEKVVDTRKSCQINLAGVRIDGSPSDVVVTVDDTEYTKMPVYPDLFPIVIDGDKYNGELSYDSDGIEFRVLREGDLLDGLPDWGPALDVTDMPEKYGDVLALYLVACVSRWPKDL